VVSDEEHSIKDIRNFWETHPLCAYEIPYEPGTPEFFQRHDQLKTQSTDRFNMHLWEFGGHTGERVLDVGCGPGWLVQEYAKRKAKIIGIDLTYQAVSLTMKRLKYQRLEGIPVQANAESLPFKDNTFDFVSCSGVLHHTPDTVGGIHEINRVLKPGHKAVISFYYRSFVFHPTLWWISRGIIRRLYLKTGFRKEGKHICNVDDFIRLYDGDGNPLGKAYSRAQVKEMFSCFTSVRYEIHYFPKRFFDPYFKIENTAILKLLDKYFGTMIFAVAVK
jgi:ubiquinone/menaquinone biosynthesis C-methylase UbiE